MYQVQICLARSIQYITQSLAPILKVFPPVLRSANQLFSRRVQRDVTMWILCYARNVLQERRPSVQTRRKPSYDSTYGHLGLFHRRWNHKSPNAEWTLHRAIDQLQYISTSHSSRNIRWENGVNAFLRQNTKLLCWPHTTYDEFSPTSCHNQKKGFNSAHDKNSVLRVLLPGVPTRGLVHRWTTPV